ncbi:hypothetical protein ElyMa_002980400 [Elysia marginata]|uniref:Uncharacterized protein n=1 Tax=Elysia marginata TaxID=1093978 RepID=A0AAV4IAK6_9GAST|nr:hypothetical protein ElyMa_002980400 [Elysia marginata]
MSQWPRKCHASQTATSVPSSIGYTFEMTTTLPGGSSSSSGSSSSIVPIIAAVVGVLVAGAVTALLVYLCVFKGLWAAMPCSRGKKDQAKSKVSPVDSGQPEVPTDAKTTGLTATAITTPGRATTDSFRHLETAQSTRSAITPSNLQTDLILEEQKPRRLPVLDPVLQRSGIMLLTNEASGLSP